MKNTSIAVKISYTMMLFSNNLQDYISDFLIYYFDYIHYATAIIIA